VLVRIFIEPPADAPEVTPVMARLWPLLHEDQPILGVSALLVKAGGRLVIRLGQEVDLPAPLRAKPRLQLSKDRRCVAKPAPVRPGGQPVHPAAAPVEAARHRCAQATFVFGHQDKFRVTGEDGR
jgi:hypothetical protein